MLLDSTDLPENMNLMQQSAQQDREERPPPLKPKIAFQ